MADGVGGLVLLAVMDGVGEVPVKVNDTLGVPVRVNIDLERVALKLCVEVGLGVIVKVCVDDIGVFKLQQYSPY